MVGADLHPDADAAAARIVARARGAAGRAGADRRAAGRPGPIQRRNFALARAAAEAFLGALDAAAVAAAAAARSCPGACRSSIASPLTLLDGAHNPERHGRAGRVAARPFAAGRRRGRGLSILDDKDAAAMLRGSCRTVRRVVFHAQRQPAGALAGDARVAGRPARRPPGDRSASPAAALARARELAGADGPCWRPARSTSSPTCSRPAGAGARPCVNDEREQPRFIAMIALVAIIVARRDPRVLRARLPVRSGLPVTAPVRTCSLNADARRRRSDFADLYSRCRDARLAVFGINNGDVNPAVNLLILFLVVIWLALIFWTYADARRRIADPMLIGCATPPRCSRSWGR